MYSALSVELSPKGVILVEDRAAREFTRALFLKLAPYLLHTLELRVAGSESELLASVVDFPTGGDWFGIVGLFDGDMRNSLPGRLAERQRKNKPIPKWPYVFLPGEFAPETVLRMAASNQADKLAGYLCREVDDVRLALSNMQGREHHDWLEDLARELRMSYGQLVDALVGVWLDVDGNLQLAQVVVDLVVEKMSGQAG